MKCCVTVLKCSARFNTLEEHKTSITGHIRSLELDFKVMLNTSENSGTIKLFRISPARARELAHRSEKHRHDDLQTQRPPIQKSGGSGQKEQARRPTGPAPTPGQRTRIYA